jgi:plastocyanin
MKSQAVVSMAILSTLLVVSCRRTPPEESSLAPEPSAARGTIRGHVRLTGPAPEEVPIRMRADPMCDKANGGKTVRWEAVVADADGNLANVFVRLQGSFPSAAAPTTAVTIDQRGCLYVPRVVGLQLGQPLRVLNSDPGLHNVHGTTKGTDGFNIGQPMAGMVNEFHLKEEGILHLQCDVHSWMVAFVGVVNHPYFAVTGAPGTFEIRDVPVGTHAIEAWHEQYGTLAASVRVEANAVADVNFSYTGQEKPAASVPSISVETGALVQAVPEPARSSAP